MGDLRFNATTCTCCELLTAWAGTRGPGSQHNTHKDGQTFPQALDTVADDERVGHIIHPPSRLSSSLSSRRYSQDPGFYHLSWTVRPYLRRLLATTHGDDLSHD